MAVERLNVTRQFHRYRDVLRLAWNLLVAEDEESLHSYEVYAAFGDFRRSLLRLIFLTVVPEGVAEVNELRDLNLIAESSVSVALIPALLDQQGFDTARPISLPPGTRCDIETTFDFGNMGPWDLQYVLVTIRECSDVSLVGRKGLIESRWANVFAV